MIEDTKNTADTAPTATAAANDFPTAYIRLRTIIDSLEMTALRYFLKDTDAAKRIKRAKEIEDQLMPVIRKLENKSLVIPGVCPDGYETCNGCCVPYPCPLSN